MTIKIKLQDKKFLTLLYGINDMLSTDNIFLWIYGKENRLLIHFDSNLNKKYFTIKNESVLIDLQLLIDLLRLLSKQYYTLLFAILRKNSTCVSDLAVLLTALTLCSIVYTNLSDVSSVLILLNSKQPVIVYNNTFNRIVLYKNKGNKIILKLYGLHLITLKLNVDLYYLLTDINLWLYYYLKILYINLLFILLLPNYSKYIKLTKYVLSIVKLYTLLNFSNKVRAYISSNINNTLVYSKVLNLLSIVHYSSLLFRLNTFVNKLKSIQDLSDKTDIFYTNKLNLILQSFDILLYNLYHILDFLYAVPKDNITLLPVNYNTQSFIDWYDSTLLTFRQYDYDNLNVMYKLFPLFLQNDSLFMKFINTIAFFIDCLIWIKINSLKLIYSIDLKLYSGVDKNLSLLLLYMLKLNNVSNLSDIIDYLFNTSIALDGSKSINSNLYQADDIYMPLSNKQKKQVLLKRIYNNLSYILKSKGTKLCIYYIANCFGLPRYLLDVKLYSNDNDISLSIYLRNKYVLTLDGSILFDNVANAKALLFTTTLNTNNSLYITVNSVKYTLYNINDVISLDDTPLDIIMNKLNKLLTIYILIPYSKVYFTVYYAGNLLIPRILTEQLLDYLNSWTLNISNLKIKNIKLFQNALSLILIGAHNLFNDSLYTALTNLILNYYSLSHPTNLTSIINLLINNDYALLITYNTTSSVYPYSYIKLLVSYDIQTLPFIQLLFSTSLKIKIKLLLTTDKLYVNSLVNKNDTYINNKVLIQLSPTNIVNDYILSIYGSLLYNTMSIYLMQTNILSSIFSKFRFKINLNQYNTLVSYYNNNFYKLILNFIPANCISYLGYTIKNSVLYKNAVLTNKISSEYLNKSSNICRFLCLINSNYVDLTGLFLLQIIITGQLNVNIIGNVDVAISAPTINFTDYYNKAYCINNYLKNQVVNSSLTSYNGLAVVQIEYINKDSILIRR